MRIWVSREPRRTNAPGAHELVTKVTLGQVGTILSTEVTRLSRNCSDWYPLLDVCGYRGCLIADHDGIYDPATTNGRLLLGLKGQLSEFELHTIRARMTAGLLNKAQRGELALPLPIGLVRDVAGQVHKAPNREIQDRIDLIFASFVRLRSASRVLHFLNEHALQLPRRDRFGDVIWKRPTGAAILEILKNPAYAGAFVYGRTRTLRTDRTTRRAKTIRLPVSEWRICVKGVYPAYISWDLFERIQAMLLDNYAEYDRNKTRGVPRDGAALLHGIVYCGECGHKMVVQYKGGTRYLCNFLRQKYGVPVCQDIAADPVDVQVVEAFFQALSPVELDVYTRAVATQQEATAQILHAHQQHLERLGYQATLAERQFLHVDPENRLVAAEFERRWEMALAELKRAEETGTPSPAQVNALSSLSQEQKELFQAIGQHLPRLWRQGDVAQRQKKALLRCLIDKVVIHRPLPETVHARIVWRGGETTTLNIPVAVGSLKDLVGAQDMERLSLEWSVQGQTDEEIAQKLTAQGFRSPMQPFVLPSTVRGMRLKHRQFRVRSQSHLRHIEGALTISQLAERLDITPHWIYDRIHNGTIQITREATTHLYLFPDKPSTLEGFAQLTKGTLKTLHF
ncbi:recombinase family protein [Ktedonospora formicarum]|uniref:Recombinase family protein n=1 Tax=Ktedonospora formicarum TaxID=2778364 RepID=A0A8J3MWD3_9CHLR|nr:recombinase family protein [Ktedonospora formicarum]GHO48866.1 hypothetical protein KSX_70290 [Ktedonospora formicarum]